MVRISRHGRPLVTFREQLICKVRVLPLVDPHSADLMIQTFSGGAHYRTVIYLIHLGPRLCPLLTFSADNSDEGEFKDLDHDGRQELIAWDDSFAYCDFSFAASPYLPFVFRYENGRYHDATSDYRWFVKADQDHAQQKLLGDISRKVFAPNEPMGDPWHQALWRQEALRSGAIQIYGDGLLLGRPKQAAGGCGRTSRARTGAGSKRTVARFEGRSKCVTESSPTGSASRPCTDLTGGTEAGTANLCSFLTTMQSWPPSMLSS